MAKIILIIVIFCLLLVKFKNHIKIKYITFFKKGFFKSSKPYGVYCYCGKQGKGKTYSVVEFLLENKDKEIYSNIKSIKCINYTYINGIDELLELRSKRNCIIVFDEIFTILQKGTKMSGDILDFLSQMRKREMIFITTAQEWLEINITLRRYCRYQIECNMISPFGYPILIKRMYDAEQMKWSQEDNEYVAPIIATTISHGLKKIIDSYDTYEQIGKYSISDLSENDVFSLDTQEKNIIENTDNLSNYYTTTNSNSIVNSQLTNDLHENEPIKLNDTNTNFSNIDNGFWDDLIETDFD